MDARTGLLAWVHGRPVGLVMLSIEAVRSADAIGEAVDGICQEQSWAKPFLRYQEEHFYRYYVDSDAFLRDFARTIFGEEEAAGILLSVEFFRRLRSWPPGRLRRLLAKVPEKQRRKLLKYVRRVLVLLLRKQLASVATDTDDFNLDWPRLVTEPAIQFFFQCAVPCYLHCGTSPQELFSRATAEHPDLRALRELIKLDKRVAHHAAVRATVHHQDRATRRRRLDVLGSALRSYPRRLKRKAVKERVGGLLSKVSEGLGRRMSASDIQQLFDEVRRIQSGGRELRDGDLPTSNDAFRGRINNARKKIKLPGVDESKLKTVRTAPRRAS
jgi:hypothetical protein